MKSTPMATKDNDDIQVIQSFAEKLLKKQKENDPEFQKIADEHFFDMLE